MDIPSLSKKIMERAFDGTASPRQAIKAKCLDCCHYDRNEAASCTVNACPLWKYNPYRVKKSISSATASPVSVQEDTED